MDQNDVNEKTFILEYLEVEVPSYSKKRIFAWHAIALSIQIAVGLLATQILSKLSHSDGFYKFVNGGLVGYFTDEDLRVFFVNFAGFSIGTTVLAAASLAIQRGVFPKPYLKARAHGLSKTMAIVLGLLCMFFGVSVFQIF